MKKNASILAVIPFIYTPYVLSVEKGDDRHHAEIYHGFNAAEINAPKKPQHKYKPQYGTVAGNNDSSIAIGLESNTLSDSAAISIGDRAYAGGEHSLAIGGSSYADTAGAIAVGSLASVQAKDGLALGTSSLASMRGSVALGASSRTQRGPDSITELFTNNKIGTMGEVSVGSENAGYFRQITNVAGGTRDNDVPTIAQLKAVRSELRNELDGLKQQQENEPLQEIKTFEPITNEKISPNDTAGYQKDTTGEKTEKQKGKRRRSELIKKYAEAATKNMQTAQGAIEKIEKSVEDAKTASDNALQYETIAEASSNNLTKREQAADGILAEIKKNKIAAQFAADMAAGSMKSTDVSRKHVAEVVKQLDDEIAQISRTVLSDTDGTIHFGPNLEGSVISVSGTQGDRVVTGVANGLRNNDAANISQLNQVRDTATSAHGLAQKNTSRINNLENQLSKTNKKIDRGLAASAALTGLFQPYGVGKINFTAGMGGSGSSQAIAVGSGYRINENAAVKAGLAYSGGNNVMYNASFNLEW